MSESPCSSESCTRSPVIACVAFGLKVWASEMAWLLRQALAGLETRQLSKRMAQERARSASAPTQEERDAAAGQAAFLEEELGRLAQDRAARREHYVAARLKAWGLDRN